MKKSYRLVRFDSFDRVNYYTLQEFNESGEDVGPTETDKFFNQFEDTDAEIRELAHELYGWIENLGNKRGAKHYYFRKEAPGQGLPPPAEHSGLRSEGGRTIRLYCKRLSDEVVVLFNGAEKTHNDPTQCENCKDHFSFCRKAAYKLDRLMEKGELLLNGKEIKHVNKHLLEI